MKIFVYYIGKAREYPFAYQCFFMDMVQHMRSPGYVQRYGYTLNVYGHDDRLLSSSDYAADQYDDLLVAVRLLISITQE